MKSRFPAEKYALKGEGLLVPNLRVDHTKIDFRPVTPVLENFGLKNFFKMARAKIRVENDPSIFGQIFLHTYYYTCAKSKMVQKCKISRILPIWYSEWMTLIFARGILKKFFELNCWSTDVISRKSIFVWSTLKLDYLYFIYFRKKYRKNTIPANLLLLEKTAKRTNKYFHHNTQHLSTCMCPYNLQLCMYFSTFLSNHVYSSNNNYQLSLEFYYFHHTKYNTNSRSRNHILFCTILH